MMIAIKLHLLIVSIKGKSNQNLENYDVLIFARRDLKSVTIPFFIKIISIKKY